MTNYRFPAHKTVALDGEYSGINTERDRFIQYGVYGTAGPDGPLIELGAVVDAETPTGRDPATIPGVSDTDVAAAVPLREGGHLDRLHAALSGAVVVIQKANFDWPLLKAEFRRNGRRPPDPHSVVCTLGIARTTLKLEGRHNLRALCERFGVRNVHAHNAPSDAKATFEVYVRMLNAHWLAAIHQQPWLERQWVCRSTHWAHRVLPGLPWLGDVVCETRPAAPACGPLDQYQHRPAQ